MADPHPRCPRCAAPLIMEDRAFCHACGAAFGPQQALADSSWPSRPRPLDAIARSLGLSSGELLALVALMLFAIIGLVLLLVLHLPFYAPYAV